MGSRTDSELTTNTVNPHEKEKEGTPDQEGTLRKVSWILQRSSNYTKCIEEVLDYNARRRDRAVADYLSWDHIDLKRHFPSIKDSNLSASVAREVL